MKLPPPLALLWNGWKKISHAIGRVMSFIILTVVWIVAIGVYAIILKIASLFRSKEHVTYWVPVPPQDAKGLTYQF